MISSIWSKITLGKDFSPTLAQTLIFLRRSLTPIHTYINYMYSLYRFTIPADSSVSWFEGFYTSSISKCTLKSCDILAGYKVTGTYKDKEKGEVMNIEGILAHSLERGKEEDGWSMLGRQNKITSGQVESDKNTSGSNSSAERLQWCCTSCTMYNPGSSSKCSTCNSNAPLKVFQDRSGSNPSPFSFIKGSPSGHVIYGSISKGDGVEGWIGRKEVTCSSFNVTDHLKGVHGYYISPSQGSPLVAQTR